MKKVHNRRTDLGALFATLLSLSLAAPALAFEAVDTLPWPSAGTFPAYPAEELRPTHFGLHAGFLRSNNILRRESVRDGESVVRAGATFRHEQRVVGRQRVVVDARGDVFYFDKFTDLNHFAYAAIGNWNWEIGNDLSGQFVLGRDQRQVDIGETGATTRDLATTTRLAGEAAYRVGPHFRLRGGAASARAERNADEDAETRATSMLVAADYVSQLGNTLGLEYRRTNGDAPVPEFVAPLGTFVDNDFDEREIALVGAYTPGPSLVFRGRVGRTTRDYTQLAGRNFDSGTWRLGLDWLPGSKTVLGFETYHEPRSIIDIGSAHVDVKGFAFGPRWAVTSKVVLAARFTRERRTFSGDAAVLAPGVPVRDDVATLWRLALGWEFQRHWQASFAIDRGERESNTAGRDYQYNNIMAQLAWNW